ncbi:MAG TPA: electron transfer flavoprotein subunit alpha/FixB family protein [Polyangiaceae bacterium]|jgi:electron transfer flavoprotein alpha subunit|nr:electron transfer flavoprotein subunit alpha/FixB family protein [Polyangiaceae bacterium]
MAGTLVVAELEGSKVRKATLSAITFAKQLGAPFAILAVGAGAAGAAGELAAFGAVKVITVDDPSFKDYVVERFAPTAAAVVKAGGFDTVAVTATSFGKDLAPRLAAKLGAGYAPDINAVKVDGVKRLYRRPTYAGNALSWLEIATPMQVVSVRQTEFTAAEPSGGASPVEAAAKAPDDAAAAQVEFQKLEVGKSERPDLGEARVVVSGGRSLKEQFKQIIEPLADLLGAAIGASRAACDAGYAAPELQVGQTGRTVAPQLYVAIGISGAIQHIAGMKGSKYIVAINKDPDAPIFQISDYGLVQDLFVAVPELVKELKASS